MTSILKKILLISTILLNLSCNEKTSEIRFYPSDKYVLDETVEIIGLDTTKLNFREITNKLEDHYDNKTHMIVQFDDENITKKILPQVYGNGLVKIKNVLRIKTDSILIDDGYRISELKRILKRHYTNNGEIPYYSANYYQASVEITIDTNKTGRDLKQVLKTVTRTFDEIKTEIQDSIKLNIFFSYFRQIPPPPPPPKSDNEFNDY